MVERLTGMQAIIGMLILALAWKADAACPANINLGGQGYQCDTLPACIAPVLTTEGNN